MESIGDEAGKIDMIMVKLDSATVAADEYGLKELPAVVHFNEEVPGVFRGVHVVLDPRRYFIDMKL